MIILAVSGGLIWLFFSSSPELAGRDAVFCRPWGGCGGRVEGSWLVDVPLWVASSASFLDFSG